MSNWTIHAGIKNLLKEDDGEGRWFLFKNVLNFTNCILIPSIIYLLTVEIHFLLNYSHHKKTMHSLPVPLHLESHNSAMLMYFNDLVFEQQFETNEIFASETHKR